MNETINLLSTRRAVSLKSLAAPAPTEAELETLLTVAARVPDHGRLVPWRFIVIDGPGAERIGDVIAQAYASDHPEADADRLISERDRLRRAPLVIAVVSRAQPHAKVPEAEQLLSAGAAAMSLVVAANALGYGTNWLTEWYAFDRRVLDALGVQPTETIAGFIHIGTATEQPTDRPRPNLAEIVTRYTGQPD